MFNIEEFDIKLDTDFFGRNFVYVEEIDSTNKFLLQTKDYQKHGTVLLAENQTAGRGRLDRTWSSNKEQNLTFSILLSDSINASKINLVNLASSLSVAQAIENLYQLNVELKWPNDVLINKKKTAGILLESSSKGNKIERVVIGIGLNVNQPNFQGKYNIPPTSIRLEFKKNVSRERLLSELLNIFEENLELLDHAPEKMLNDWRNRCKLIGEKIKIDSGEETKFGLFEDIDENGLLVLKTQNGKEKIHFGDVSLR